MRMITSVHFLLLLYVNSIAFASVTEEQKRPYIKVITHNVGQGNCMTAELYSPDEEPIYLLMDAGSSAYKKELFCQKYFLEKKQRLELEKASELSRAEEYEVNSPSRTSTSTTVPQSILRAATPGESRVLRTTFSNSHKAIKDKMIKKIRNSLGMREHNDPIIVRTFFISHPDSDHYNLAHEIFINKKDKIFNIILGGLPQNYSDSFRMWLQKQIRAKKTKIYFPALTLEQPISSIDEILQQCEELKGMMYSPLYAPQMFSDPREGWRPVDHLKNFENALPFSKDIQTYLLSVNPTHWEDRGRIARASFSEDDNSDSLVIKLQVGEHSIIITGDATELTTGRILGNYSDNLDFLLTNITTSDHHGAKTHGSNNLPWVKATAPQHIIFSCGTTHGHPSLYAYENSKQSPRLARTDPHDIWVWESPEKKKGDKEEETYTKGRKVRAHTTHQSLFSTFSSGTLTLTLPEADEISIESQILDFELQKLGPKKQYRAFSAKDEFGSRSEEEGIEISINEGEFEELEKSILEERETASTLGELKAPQKSLFGPTSPYEPRRKRIKTKKDTKEEEGSLAPLIKVGQKAPLQKKGRLASQPIQPKPLRKEKVKKRLHKPSLGEEDKSQSKKKLDFEEEELVEVKQTWSRKSSKESDESEEMASLKLESSSELRKKQGAKRKQIETLATEEKVKEKFPKNQIGDGSTLKDKRLKKRASVTKAKSQPKKGQRESAGKLEKEKGTQSTTSRGKKEEKKTK